MLRVCKNCLQAIESHEGTLTKVKPVTYEECELFHEPDGIELLPCDWCDELFEPYELTQI